MFFSRSTPVLTLDMQTASSTTVHVHYNSSSIKLSTLLCSGLAIATFTIVALDVDIKWRPIAKRLWYQLHGIQRPVDETDDKPIKRLADVQDSPTEPAFIAADQEVWKLGTPPVEKLGFRSKKDGTIKGSQKQDRPRSQKANTKQAQLVPAPTEDALMMPRQTCRHGTLEALKAALLETEYPVALEKDESTTKGTATSTIPGTSATRSGSSNSTDSGASDGNKEAKVTEQNNCALAEEGRPSKSSSENGISSNDSGDDASADSTDYTTFNNSFYSPSYGYDGSDGWSDTYFASESDVDAAYEPLSPTSPMKIKTSRTAFKRARMNGFRKVKSAGRAGARSS